MDSRAKQRLTGAVILVALFVLLVPELLTGPGKDAAPAASTDEEGVRHYVIDLNAPTGTAPATTPQPAPEVQLPAVVENPMEGATRAQPGEAAQIETPTTNPEPVAAPKPAPVAQTQVPASTPAPVVKPAAPAPVPAATSPAAKGSFAVQLGSFGQKDNADRLVREMTAKGFNAFLAPTRTGDGRDIYRVRVGPTRDRAAAEALAAQLKRIGQTGTVVPIS